MSVSGVEPAAVYLSPQAISPLSASKEPIALALAVRPNLSAPDGAGASKATDSAVKAVDAAGKAGRTGTRAQDERQSMNIAIQSVAGVAAAGRVDVYV